MGMGRGSRGIGAPDQDAGRVFRGGGIEAGIGGAEDQVERDMARKITDAVRFNFAGSQTLVQQIQQGRRPT